MHFEPNQGQTADEVRYLARGAGYSLFLTDAEAVLVLRKGVAPASSRPEAHPTASEFAPTPQHPGKHSPAAQLPESKASTLAAASKAEALDSKPWFNRTPTDLASSGHRGATRYELLAQSPEPGSRNAPADPPQAAVVRMRLTGATHNRRFASGEGFVRVFVDDRPAGNIDQRHVPATSAEFENLYVGNLVPGEHRVAFRLDGFGPTASGVELTGVELGKAAQQLGIDPTGFCWECLPSRGGWRATLGR